MTRDKKVQDIVNVAEVIAPALINAGFTIEKIEEIFEGERELLALICGIAFFMRTHNASRS